MVVSGVLGRANLARARLHLRLPPEVYADTPTRVELRVENRRRLLPLLLLDVQVADDSALFIEVAPGAQQQHHLALRFPHRGYFNLPPARLESSFPINFFRRWFHQPLSTEVLVLPRPVPIPAAEARGPHGERGEYAGGRKGHDGDLLGISDYSGSEPLKLIHWKQSARQDQTKVKQLTLSRNEPRWVDPQDCPGRTLEQRLGAATWLINHYEHRGHPVGLRLAGRVIAPANGRSHRLRLLRELALYDAG